MTAADKITASRLVLSPLFFVVFSMPGLPAAVTYPLLWLLFLTIEVSDLVDGKVARASGSVSSFGKLFDPFADVMARITYFLCFAIGGLMPAWIFLIVLYREFSIMFLRMLLSSKGIAMGARPGGKLKAVLYMVSGGISLLYITLSAFGVMQGILPGMRIFVLVLYVLAAVLSLASFADYWIQFKKLYGKV